MKTFIPLLSAILILFLIIPSCKHTLPEIAPDTKDTTTNDTTKKHPCSPDTVYYTRDIQPLFNTYCKGTDCHNAPNPKDGFDVTTFSTAMASGKIKPYNSNGSKLYESLVETDPDKRMPPSGNLSSENIALIKKWIDQGAKNLYCDDIPSPCDTATVTYSKTISTILKNNCTSCHGYNGGVSLTTYAGVKTVINNGKLWNSVNHLSGISKSMPSSTTKLSFCNLRQIKIWIDAGAPQN